MSGSFYNADKNIQILIAVLKANGIHRIVASPGNTNVSFIASLQSDRFFEIYSCVDERSAAYMACGIAGETGEPVVLSCTGATASRNYYPAMTEAYYRKLPVLAVTSSQVDSRIGNLVPQVTDRRDPAPDVALLSVNLPVVKDTNDFRAYELTASRAVLELVRRGGGPVHINLQQTYNQDFSVRELPLVHPIQRFFQNDKLPLISKEKRIAVFAGAHRRMPPELVKSLDSFCMAYGAVVLHEGNSGYSGNFGVSTWILQMCGEQIKFDLLIDIGEMAGYSINCAAAKDVWRVSEDGEIRDRIGKLSSVFEMPEQVFFHLYAGKKDLMKSETNPLLLELREKADALRVKIPEIPLSYVYCAQKTCALFPAGSRVHLAILSSFRAWNLFEFPRGVEAVCNTGGFGIDGCLSTCVGSSIVSEDRLHFMITGDLAFFYDMNVLGNRHIGANLRILLVNNNEGMEMAYPGTYPIQSGISDPYSFNTARGHYSAKSKDMVKDFAQSCGFEYIRAETKEEFDSHLPRFLQDSPTEKPLFFEVFTTCEDESAAFEAIRKLGDTAEKRLKRTAKSAAKKLLGEKGTAVVKGILGK